MLDKIREWLDASLAILERSCSFCGKKSPEDWNKKYECCEDCKPRIIIYTP